MASKADKNSPNSKQQEYYADFTMNFDPHPDKKDLIRHVNEDAVISSIKNLLMTYRFERLNKPLLGSGIRKMLFEPMTELTEYGLREAIIDTIDNFEPRANVVECVVSGEPDQNTYNISLTISVINRADPVSIQLLLHRVR